jgi:hypothetical protein
MDNLDPREKHLIILDDLMDETDQRVASLFTKKSHHRNISIMYIVHTKSILSFGDIFDAPRTCSVISLWGF